MYGSCFVGGKNISLTSVVFGGSLSRSEASVMFFRIIYYNENSIKE